MINIFFTNTPYHVLLSYSIAKEYDRNVLLASGETPGRDLIDAIATHQESPFDQTVVIDDKSSENRLFRTLERRRNIQDIRSFVATLSHQVQRVHIFHKGSTEALALFHFLKTDGPGYETGVYVEDGIEAYSTHKIGNKSLPAVWLGKLIYGRWWHDVSPLYDSTYVQKGRVTFPEALRPELETLPTQAISPKPLLHPDMREIITEYFDTVEVRIPDEVTHVVVAPHSDLRADLPDMGHRIKAALAGFGNDSKLAIKYHPRDQSAEYLGLDAYRIPAKIPIETVYIAKQNLERIIGGRSTAIMTAKWLTDAEVLSVYLDWDDSDPVINTALKNMGIQAIDTDTYYDDRSNMEVQ